VRALFKPKGLAADADAAPSDISDTDNSDASVSAAATGDAEVSPTLASTLTL